MTDKLKFNTGLFKNKPVFSITDANSRILLSMGQRKARLFIDNQTVIKNWLDSLTDNKS